MRSIEQTSLLEAKWEGFPLSAQQENLITQFGKQNLGYISSQYSITGFLDYEILSEALATLINNYEILRTSFKNALGEDSDALMVIDEPYHPQINIVDVTDSMTIAIEDGIQALVNSKIFNTTQTLKATLYRESANKHVLIIAMPKPCIDFLSATHLMTHLAEIYAAKQQGLMKKENPIVQYVDFAQWQLEEISKNSQKALPSELKALANNTSLIHLPLELKSESLEQQQHKILLPSESQTALLELAKKLGIPIRSILLACWSTALWRVSGNPEQLMLLTNIAGRPFAELQSALGLFEYVAPSTVHPRSDMTLAQFVSHCHQVHSQTEKYNSLPRNDKQRLPSELGFAFFTASPSVTINNLNWENQTQYLSNERLKLLLVASVGTEIHLDMHFQAGGFVKEGIEAINQAFKSAVQAIINTPEQALDRFPLLTEDDANTLFEKTNPTPSNITEAECWHYKFINQVKKNPNARALKFNDRMWTYAQLDHFTNQLARHIIDNGIHRGMAVGLMTERSDLAIAMIIAIHKAGAYYVPIDPQLPIHRFEAIINQTQPALLLVSSQFPRLADINIPVLAIDTHADSIRKLDNSTLASVTDIEDIAYVLFTSGSTGEPKGVKISHLELQNYINGIIERAGLQDALSYLSIGPITTDLGNTVLFPALVTGGSIEVSPVAHIEDTQELIRYMSEAQYDVLKLTPSHLASLFVLVDDPTLIIPNKVLLLGGEVLSWGVLRLFKSFANKCNIYNHYGPTETCVGVVAQHITSDEYATLTSTVPLGKPLKHARCYVLDSYGIPVPIGVSGELYIGGSTVARGYVQSSEKDQNRFILDPWNSAKNATMYRSGDKVRWLPDGSLEFLGRLDRQIKVNGFRVELAEIEVTLRKHPDILDSCVIEHGESGSRHLLAYVIMKDGSSGNASWLREHLENYLPHFMIPPQIVSIPRFPLNHNGKIDTRMLPAPDTIVSVNLDNYLAPQSETEKAVATIFQELLLVQTVGLADDFFELGGHSLIATQLVSRIRKKFSIAFSLRSVFMDATVAGLSNQIDALIE